LNKGQRQINVRVSVEDDNLVRELDGSWTDILRIGFEKWASEYPDFLMKKTQEYKELYSKCIANQGKLYTNAIQTSNGLEDIYKVYVSTGRDVDNPTAQDRSWVKARLSGLKNGSRVSVAQWFVFAQKKYLNDKQRKLEVEE
jgi:hypothetical protein